MDMDRTIEVMNELIKKSRGAAGGPWSILKATKDDVPVLEGIVALLEGLKWRPVSDIPPADTDLEVYCAESDNYFIGFIPSGDDYWVDAVDNKIAGVTHWREIVELESHKMTVE